MQKLKFVSAHGERKLLLGDVKVLHTVSAFNFIFRQKKTSVFFLNEVLVSSGLLSRTSSSQIL